MEAVFLKVCNMGLTASWLILAVILLRFVLRKAPKWISCLLWALVALRLVCPFTIESALSLIPSSEPLPEEIITDNTFQVNTGMGLVDVPVNEYLGDHYYEGVTVPADNGNHVMHILGMIWIAGVIILLFYSFISYYRLYRLTRASVNLRENIYLCDAIDTPFILGIIRPRIYLPSDMEMSQAEYVVAHERAHLKRKDHWWKPAGFLILSVYWFQPLCWVSYILLCRDIELACDERVILDMGSESKKPYAEALLACSVKQNLVTACPLAFGEVGVKERVKNVLHYKKPAFWLILAAIFCCIVAMVCFLTNPKQDAKELLAVAEEAEERQTYSKEIRIYAEHYVQEAYQAVLDSPFDYDYTDWRITLLEQCYTYEELEGKTYEIYQLGYEFLSASPENVVLTGGMSVSEDGWVVPDYADSRYLIFEKAGEELQFLTVLFENDCFPGDELFTEDVRLAIQENSVAKDRQDALKEMLDRWREAYVNRDAESIIGMITPELVDDMLMSSPDGYSFGFSSPWPWEWETDSVLYSYDEKEAEIYYYAHTSDPHITCWKEHLEYIWENDRYVITKSSTTSYDDISSYEEFMEAYPMIIDGTMMDYTRNGLGETLNNNALLSSSMAYRDLFEPESAAAFLLNLSYDPNEVRYTLREPERKDLIGMDITFLKDGGTVKISMLQPYGENGIWVSVNYRVDVVARFSKVDWAQVENLRFTGDIPDMSGILCIGEIPEEHIKLYGYNDDEAGAQGVAVEIGEDVNYFDWYYTSPQTILPKLYWDEERRQLQVSCHIYTGTGASADELHVLQQFDTGTLLDNNLDLDDYEALLEERIAYSFDENTRELVLTDRSTKTELASVTVPEELGEKVTGLELGVISDFELGEKIYFNVSPGYYIDNMFGIAQYEDMPKLRFELILEQREYGEIAFELGEIVP